VIFQLSAGNNKLKSHSILFIKIVVNYTVITKFVKANRH